MAKEDIKEDIVDLEDKEDGGQKKGASSTVKIIIIAILATFLIGGGLVGATMYFTGAFESESSVDEQENPEEGTEGEEEVEEEELEEEEVEEEEPKDPPIYQRIDPKFVVSFRDQRAARFMQFTLQVMARDEDVIKKIMTHMPAIRSSLIMLFDIQDQESLATSKGKQELLNKIVVDINETLKKVTGDDEPDAAVEAAYFTEFVIQ